MASESYATFCPKCGSVNIEEDRSYLQSAAMLPALKVCQDCGFASPHFPEGTASDIKAFKLKIKESKKD